MPAHDYADLSRELMARLRLRTDPVALKLFEDESAMNAIPGVRRPQPGVRFSMCQLVGQVRWLGWTLGMRAENVPADSNCGGVMGLNAPGRKYLDGTMFTGVWFENMEAARAHQAAMPRVPAGRFVGVVGAPLAKAKLDPPDTVLVYGTPGQIILLVNALQHRKYERFNFSTTGETACADSWGHALKTGEPSLSIPCFAERRFGGVQDDEMLFALPPAALPEAVQGLEWLGGNGIRYPIPPYGVQTDPSAAFAHSYGDKLKQ